MDGDNVGDSGMTEQRRTAKLRLSKNKQVIAAPPSPTTNQKESDADDRQTECEERGERREERLKQES